MKEEEEEEGPIFTPLLVVPKPVWYVSTKIISFQADVVCACFALFFSPFFLLLSAASLSFRQAQKARRALHAAASALTRACRRLLRKLGFGILAALSTAAVLAALLILAAAVGFGVVGLWVEDPLLLRESLQFDYTSPHPNALLWLSGTRGGVTEMRRVPLGHTVSVTLLLLMPESGYNMDLGVFQVSAELLQMDGTVIARSSQPCIMRYRSGPIRLTRTFLMGIPLLLGITRETQKLTLDNIVFNHREGKPRTEAIRISVIPRAGTAYAPQLYEAEIIVMSHLPWRKQLVHDWRWTFSVWTTLYVYTILLASILFCCRNSFLMIIPVVMRGVGTSDDDGHDDEVDEMRVWASEAREVSEVLRRWQQQSRGKKRESMFHRGGFPSTSASLASSVTTTNREDRSCMLEDVGDSESAIYMGR